MSNLPDPFTPPDCDLRGYDWMALEGERLFDSEFYTEAISDDPRGGWAGLKLWWIAMRQVPAGSLPNDERQLARFADFGADLKSWNKHRKVAMHGFVLCSDGRLYHRVVCEVALAAWQRRLRAAQTRQDTAERTRRWRAGQNGQSPSQDSAVHQDSAPNPTVTDNVTPLRVTRHIIRGDASRDGDVSARDAKTGQDRTKTVQKRPPYPPQAGGARAGFVGNKERRSRIRNPVVAEMLDSEERSPVVDNWTDYAWNEPNPDGGVQCLPSPRSSAAG